MRLKYKVHVISLSRIQGKYIYNQGTQGKIYRKLNGSILALILLRKISWKNQKSKLSKFKRLIILIKKI
jgi:hypothetical protein